MHIPIYRPIHESGQFTRAGLGAEELRPVGFLAGSDSRHIHSRHLIRLWGCTRGRGSGEGWLHRSSLSLSRVLEAAPPSPKLSPPTPPLPTLSLSIVTSRIRVPARKRGRRALITWRHTAYLHRSRGGQYHTTFPPYTRTRAHTRTQAHTHARTRAHARTHTSTLVRVHARARAHARTHANIRARARTHTHRAHTRAHTGTQAHRHRQTAQPYMHTKARTDERTRHKQAPPPLGGGTRGRGGGQHLTSCGSPDVDLEPSESRRPESRRMEIRRRQQAQHRSPSLPPPPPPPPPRPSRLPWRQSLTEQRRQRRPCPSTAAASRAAPERRPAPARRRLAAPHPA